MKQPLIQEFYESNLEYQSSQDGNEVDIHQKRKVKHEIVNGSLKPISDYKTN